MTIRLVILIGLLSLDIVQRTNTNVACLQVQEKSLHGIKAINLTRASFTQEVVIDILAGKFNFIYLVSAITDWVRFVVPSMACCLTLV